MNQYPILIPNSFLSTTNFAISSSPHEYLERSGIKQRLPFCPTGKALNKQKAGQPHARDPA